MAPLSQLFPSLLQPIASSHMLCLYFASSWCPDCTPVTPVLKSVYESQRTVTDSEKKLMEVVYVSSDSNVQQMEESMNKAHGKWSFVPFQEEEELANIKRKFGACAAKEAPRLSLLGPGRRKFGIPTLIVIDCESENILTTNGVTDIMMNGADSLKIWDDIRAEKQ
eukprot:CAMPEP_0197832552 /NCGR_PEP_ID=MMETSP1437-20131217/15268_1 /TAXON_ID=49252 ORGANISM="Eucampia antarctica, Strain CCMP1452" /NCGR_SAMPLE_ID=MMETSP1437 /ASSEMBLY_ACC=CAM_ASM_001096 /LENGTH=165 /DNA_ID=CAMNT_0043435983 /DNA_START=9 /DNA_END=506 /DNA_ORIENTATION=+